MKIPNIMCHGISEKLTLDRLEKYYRTAFDLGFQSISYEDLYQWYAGKFCLPERPIMFDFDHPVKSIRHGIFEIMNRYGFKGNLFIYTEPLEKMYSEPLPDFNSRSIMTWGEINELREAGWNIGSHTHTHPNLSEMRLLDPEGEHFRIDELEKCDEIVKRELGIETKDFAFVGITWSSIAEKEVMKRYRFARLWIVGSEYLADGKKIRYAELACANEEDEKDGGPPKEVRYINKKTNPYRLPAMELEYLIYDYSSFCEYLEDAIEQ